MNNTVVAMVIIILLTIGNRRDDGDSEYEGVSRFAESAVTGAAEGIGDA